MSDDVGVNMLAKVEANRKAARAGTLRVIIGNTRYPREIQKRTVTGVEFWLQMRRPRQRSSL